MRLRLEDFGRFPEENLGTALESNEKPQSFKRYEQLDYIDIDIFGSICQCKSEGMSYYKCLDHAILFEERVLRSVVRPCSIFKRQVPVVVINCIID
ncbi:hypothetical protein WA026_001364 [Henosepilachna vigintioctopunctata]|uniref:Uncharacterized protein n=1 Tax=Henosepilachna vigintioctopunctata TaxID=420089 RepID=A0AAW1UQQ5_9CUCU